MQKVITLKLLALILASCASNPQTTSDSSVRYETAKAPMCKHEIKPTTRDPLEILLSNDPFDLYEDTVKIPYLPTPENKAKALPTFQLSCVD